MIDKRIRRVLSAMEQQGLTQMLISDPGAIYYLTGKWIHPGERMLALYLNTNGNHKLIVNELFPITEDLGVDLLTYCDTDAPVELLAKYGEIKRVQRALNHGSESVTMIYALADKQLESKTRRRRAAAGRRKV